MKYFSSDLLARFGSTDPVVADAAQAEWEERTASYQEHLRSIRKQLPRGLKGMLRRYYLHDALLSFIGRAGEVLHLTLRLDPPPHPTVFLQYRLAEQLTVSKTPDWHDDVHANMYWLYDEIDLIAPGAFPIIEQRILLTNGVELGIRFQDMVYSSAEPLPLFGDGTIDAIGVEMVK